MERDKVSDNVLGVKLSGKLYQHKRKRYQPDQLIKGAHFIESKSMFSFFF